MIIEWHQDGVDVYVLVKNQGEPKPLGTICGHPAELVRGEIKIGKMPKTWMELVQGVKEHAEYHHKRFFSEIVRSNPDVRDDESRFRMQFEDVDIGAWQHPLPEPGVYELGICGLAGKPVRGGMLGRLQDSRSFDTSEGRRLLAEQGFEGSTSLILAMLMWPNFMLSQGKWISMPMPEQCWRDPVSRELYLLYYVFEEDVQGGVLRDHHWKLALGKVDYAHQGDVRMIGFKKR